MLTKYPEPVATVASAKAYGILRPQTPVDLHLNANEGRGPSPELIRLLGELPPEIIARYAKPTALQHKLAELNGVTPNELLVTTGGDDGIDRVCRTFLAPGRRMLIPTPTFEMFNAFGKLTGAQLEYVPWTKDGFPTAALIDALSDSTGLITVISPNNPTGLCASADDLQRLSAAAPQAVILLDLAYGEFNQDDSLERMAKTLPNVIRLKTLSKAWGLAGLRLGYLLGPETLIDYIKRVGGPYPSSTLSLAMAMLVLERGTRQKDAYIARVKTEREALYKHLVQFGATPYPSRTNFVFCETPARMWLRDALSGFGIAVRPIAPDGPFAGGLRITCPGDDGEFARVKHALASCLAPQALLFDMDGVLADVRGSYREAIRQTCAAFGVTVTPDQIAAQKALPDNNNDWVASLRLIEAAGNSAELHAVTDVFERLYHGTDDAPGLHANETLTVPVAFLQRLADKLPLAIVTGRPKRDTERFLKRFGIADMFSAVITMTDAPAKPDPAPLKLAMQQLGVSRAWMLGDSPDDMQAARKAAALPIGVALFGDGDAAQPALNAAGAGLVISELSQLEEWIDARHDTNGGR